jgi:fluoride exporter
VITALAVAGGAVVGAPLRYLADRAVQSRHESRFPHGTLLVNLVASLVLGFVTGISGISPAVAALLGTGFCGTLSTYSTYAFETFRLGEVREWWPAVLNVVLSVGLGLALASVGFWLGGRL